ncbi:hypothetical protein GCM10023214_01670 [Amycolatopsis dongchuanensis]|uniref:RDD family protein n=1 Tax=Amycolatopsis dongchuanensis TaxID=1070866 RepID=A0ABP9PS61_9PSEU
MRIAVFTEDLIDWLRWRAFSLVWIRLIWDLMLATLALLDLFGGSRCRVSVAPADRVSSLAECHTATVVKVTSRPANTHVVPRATQRPIPHRGRPGRLIYSGGL